VLREAVKVSPSRSEYRDAETSLLEGVFTRGDRRLCAVVEDAYAAAAAFDACERAPALATWLDVFASHGLDPERYLIERSNRAGQPWDLVQSPSRRSSWYATKLRGR